MADSRSSSLLSVVVPFHDVERYFAACLDSLAQQSWTDLDVILVDDGSTDGSRAIAEDFCARDPRFRVIGEGNQGSGPARNLGVQHARGDYLAFVDSDDVVDRRGHERLVRRLAGSGSDFAIGRAVRFTNLGVTASMVHQIAITESLIGTQINMRPELVLDRMIWNTVYRRSFWDAAELSFSSFRFEDFPLSMQAHAAATAVDLIDEVVYFWRERDGGTPSVSQHSAQPEFLEGRFVTAGMVLDVITDAAPASLPILRRHLLEVDITAMTLALDKLVDPDRGACLEWAQRLLDRLGPEAELKSPPFYKVQAALVRQGDQEGLAALHLHAHRLGKTGPLQVRGWLRPKFYEVLPGLGSRVPKAAFELRKGRPPVVATLDDAAWADDGTLAVRILLDPGLSLGAGAKVSVWLQDPKGVRTACPAEMASRAGAFVGADLVEVHARLDPSALPDPGTQGFRALHVRVSAPGTEAEVLVAASRGRARFLPARSLTSGLLVRPEPRGPAGFGLALIRARAVLTGCSVAEGTLCMTGILRSRLHETGQWAPDEAHLTVTGREGLVLSCPVQLEPVEDGFAFVGSIPVLDLADGPEYLAATAMQKVYSVRLETRTGTGAETRTEALALVVDAGTPDVGCVVGHRSVRATRNAVGNLELVESRTAPELLDVRWVGPTTLRFEGVWAGPAQLPAEVLCQHYEHPSDGIGLAVGLIATGTTYTFEVDVTDLLRLADAHRDPYHGRDPDPWHLLIPFSDHVATQVFDRTRVSGFAEPRTVGSRRVQLLLARDDVVRIGIGG